jgi:hypothetical protein
MFKIIFIAVGVLFVSDGASMDNGSAFITVVHQNASSSNTLSVQLQNITKENFPKSKSLADKYLVLYGKEAVNAESEQRVQLLSCAERDHEKDILLGAAELVARSNFDAGCKSVFKQENLQEAIRLFNLLLTDRSVSNGVDNVKRLLSVAENCLVERQKQMPQLSSKISYSGNPFECK